MTKDEGWKVAERYKRERDDALLKLKQAESIAKGYHAMLDQNRELLLRLSNIRTIMENMDLRDEHTMALLHALEGAKIVETENSYSVVEKSSPKADQWTPEEIEAAKAKNMPPYKFGSE